MKRILFTAYCCLCILSLFAQYNHDQEYGMRLYESERYEEALSPLQKASKAGSNDALTALSDMYYYGKGVACNKTISNNLLEKALAKNHPKAAYQKALFLDDEGKVTEAFGWFKKAADLNFSVAIEMVARMYADGIGVSKDNDQAFAYYLKAAESGSSSAKVALGCFYYAGMGTEVNNTEAFRCISPVYQADKQALITYNADACLILSTLYYTGKGTTQNYEKALEILDEIKAIIPDKIEADFYEQVRREANKEESPEFPGGAAAMMKFLSQNVKYPKAAVEGAVEGRVIIQFIVSKDGSIVNPVVIRGVNPHLDNEALRLVRMMPRWKPGIQKGNPVRVKYTLPVTFSLN